MPLPTFPQINILIVDDEADILKSFDLTLKTGGINNVLKCQDARQVMATLEDKNVCAVLLDLSMPHISGEKLLQKIIGEHPDISVIVITGDNEVDTAVRCMKLGAVDYMVKPVEKSRLVSGVKKVIEIHELQNQNRLLKEKILEGKLARPEPFHEMVTNNKTMLSLFQYTESIAVSPQPVLITGETGVGKELMARAIHTLSGRTGEFVCVNAAGIDDNVFADTLFGHVKGAYTGADQARKGLVEKASKGTLLLDEIGDLSLESQVKLLRLIQEGEYFPLGSDLAKTTNARIVVSTNLDLNALQQSGKFRKDLYYRLRAHHLLLPPLRERLEDLPLLLDHFLAEAAHRLEKSSPTYPFELITLLSNYAFPGNVRELRTMVYDALSTHKTKMLSTGRFQEHMKGNQGSVKQASVHDPFRNLSSFQITGPLPTLKQAVRVLIAEAMKRTHQNQSMAAKLLGITRQTLARNLDIKGDEE
ncbi:MAG: sigma-54 dependent transcriptional regulator [Proteobacteria bacterium]|nr:sigma-54 dependent transcriptional regulator [Pseudomonadota bacterium]MBU4471448.1 sigma-54 dependent transcriptional regulator [Pseudomonadota bacterium]MCG2752455.1 sigma-54 dependent transcriptional regulator [Desulfobacteraceae bacterium]